MLGLKVALLLLLTPAADPGALARHVRERGGGRKRRRPYEDEGTEIKDKVIRS
jgi:hypothetical protein